MNWKELKGIAKQHELLTSAFTSEQMKKNKFANFKQTTKESSHLIPLWRVSVIVKGRKLPAKQVQLMIFN